MRPPNGLTDRTGRLYNAHSFQMRTEKTLRAFFWAKLGIEDKGPKTSSLDGSKFHSRGASVRLQGARKKLRVMSAEVVRKPVILVL